MCEGKKRGGNVVFRRWGHLTALVPDFRLFFSGFSVFVRCDAARQHVSSHQLAAAAWTCVSSRQLSRPAVLSIRTHSAWFSRRPSHHSDHPRIFTVLRMLPCVSSCLVFHSVSSVFPSVRRVPPRFSIPPTDNEIMPGGSVNITCVAVGSPMPYVKWMLGAEDLTPEDDMPIGRNVLELTDVRQSANYTCVAMSTLGVIEAMAQITVKGKRQASDVGSVKKTKAVPEPESI